MIFRVSMMPVEGHFILIHLERDLPISKDAVNAVILRKWVVLITFPYIFIITFHFKLLSYHFSVFYFPNGAIYMYVFKASII